MSPAMQALKEGQHLLAEATSDHCLLSQACTAPSLASSYGFLFRFEGMDAAALQLCLPFVRH